MPLHTPASLGRGASPTSCWGGGRWNAALRHPGLTQPGVSHTHSLASFSARFIPLPTQCLPRSLLPTDEAQDQGSRGCRGNVPTAGRAARVQDTGRHPVDRGPRPPTQGRWTPVSALGWLMFSRTHRRARSEKEGLFLWGLQMMIKNPQRKRKMYSGSFAVCSHGRGQQSEDQREPGQHVIMTVSAIWHLAVGSLHGLGPHCSVWSTDQQHWHCPGASQNAECRSHLELLKQNLHFNQTPRPPTSTTDGGLYTYCSLLSAALDQHFSILATHCNHLAKVPMPGSTPRDDHLIVLGCCWDHRIFLRLSKWFYYAAKVENHWSHIYKQKKKIKKFLLEFLDYKQNHRNLCKQLNKIHWKEIGHIATGVMCHAMWCQSVMSLSREKKQSWILLFCLSHLLIK